MNSKFDNLLDEVINESKKKFKTERDKEILEAIRGIVDFVKKEIIKTRVLLNKRKISYNELEDKPYLLNRDDIDNQIKEREIRLSALLNQAKSIIRIMGEQNNQKFSKLESQINSILNNKDISHDELKDVTPDQHHSEEHTLESHTDSDYMDKFKRLISGDIVDDLHKHRLARVPEIEVYGGATSASYLAEFLGGDYEDLSSQCNGVLTTFTVSGTIHAVISIILNNSGVLCKGIDYTVSGNTITLLTVTPTSGEKLYVQYI